MILDIRSSGRSVLWLSILICAAAGVGSTLAYDQYSVDGDDTNCGACHGDFRANSYTSLSDGGSWVGGLHTVHRFTMVDGDCDTCHGSSNFPVVLGDSLGGTGLAAIGCAGCHGRAEDGTGTGSEGYAAGLRQHHFRAGETGCLTCHADADPAAFTPVGEDVMPPYYSLMDTAHPDMPNDPCSPSPDFTEDFNATSTGTDNDGDGAYDEADNDCGAVQPGPGEVSEASMAMLTVTGHDSVAGTVTFTYAPACSATDNNIEFGPLTSVGSYIYSGQECSIGNTGTYTWTYDASSVFFIVVANDGSIEGSYGLDDALNERPEDNVNTACPIPWDVTNRCD